MHAVGTIIDSNGAAWTMDEENGSNLVAVVSWDLPDIVDLETRDNWAILKWWAGGCSGILETAAALLGWVWEADRWRCPVPPSWGLRHSHPQFVDPVQVRYTLEAVGWGARCSSVVTVFAHGAMGRQIDPSQHPLSYFLFQPVLHNWCNKGCGLCYPVYGIVHIKEPLLLIGKSSPCGGSGFPLSLSEWYFTICPTPYNHK